MLHSFFWVIPWHLYFICRHFRTLCLFHLHRLCGSWTAYENGRECSETSVYKIQTPGNHPKESIQDINRYFPVLDSRPADILFGHRNYFQRKDYAELREHILCYEHEVLPGHFLSFSSHRIPSLRAIQYIIVLIMYLLLFPTAQNTCTKNRP